MKIKIPSLSMRGRPRKKVGAISYLESSSLTAHAGLTRRRVSRPLVKGNEDAGYEGASDLVRGVRAQASSGEAVKRREKRHARGHFRVFRVSLGGLR